MEARRSNPGLSSVIDGHRSNPGVRSNRSRIVDLFHQEIGRGGQTWPFGSIADVSGRSRTKRVRQDRQIPSVGFGLVAMRDRSTRLAWGVVSLVTGHADLTGSGIGRNIRPRRAQPRKAQPKQVRKGLPVSLLGDDAESRHHHPGVTDTMPVPDTPSFCLRRGKSVGDQFLSGDMSRLETVAFRKDVHTGVVRGITPPINVNQQTKSEN